MAPRVLPPAGRVATVAALAAGVLALAGVGALAGPAPSVPAGGGPSALALERALDRPVAGELARSAADVAPAWLAPAPVGARSRLAPVVGAAPAAPSTRAADVLATLAVKGRSAATGYRRGAFLPDGWADLDRDGCSTREEILQRDLTRTTRKRSGRCEVVASGLLADPYSGRSVGFTRGPRTSAAVQVDHVVSLGDAWVTGARSWTAQQREAFANDPLEQLATTAAQNEAKGSSDAASWLPPNKAFRCAYVARQVAVKARYGLWVTPAEQAAVARVLDSCPDRTVPSS